MGEKKKKVADAFFVFLLTPITVFIAIHLKVIGVSIMHISFLFCNLNFCPIKVNLKSINWKCIRWTAGKKMRPKHRDRTLVAGGSIHAKRQFNKTSGKTWISCQSLLRSYPFYTAIKNYFYCGNRYQELVVCLCFLHLLKNNPTHFLLPSQTTAAARQFVLNNSWLTLCRTKTTMKIEARPSFQPQSDLRVKPT